MELYIPLIDIIAIATSLLIFAGYMYLYNYRAFSTNSYSTTQLGRNLENMIMWGQKHSEDTSTATTILAIQTLRNALIVAIFVGSATLGLAAQNTIPLNCDVTSPQLEVRSTVLSSMLFLSFLNWALVIRYGAHAGFMIGALPVWYRVLKKEADAVEAEKALNALIVGDIRSNVRGTLESESQSQTRTDGVHLDLGAGGVDADVTRERRSKISDPEVGLKEEEKEEGKKDDDDDDEKEKKEEIIAVSALKKCLSLFSLHFTWGFRFIFFSIPYFFYAKGVIPLIVSTVFTTAFLFYFDDPIAPYRASSSGKQRYQRIVNA